MAIRTYAQRLLNPFRGAMNIIEFEGAEAVTTDGLRWDIYVRDTELVEEFSNSSQVQTSDIRYGHWSEKTGLKRGAIYPSDDFKALEHRGAIVYEFLLAHHRDVPFGFADHIELWLLHEDGRPLALLDSVISEEDIDIDRPIDWRAGQQCCRQFRSSMVSTGDGNEKESAGEKLSRYVNRLAGPSPRAQWFRRRQDGSGVGLSGVNLNKALAERTLRPGAFPPDFIDTSGHGTEQDCLVREFLRWQAPWRLLLRTLSETQRRELETLLQPHAVTVEKQHRLYPQILDRGIIDAARVEAALRSQQGTQDYDPDALPPYYIELNISRTN